MTPAQKEWVKMIHIAKAKTGIADDGYRALLEGAAGVTSSTELKNWSQYKAVMAAFRTLGFKPRKKRSVDPQSERSADRISARQEYYIKGLWELVSTQKDEHSLNSFCSTITGKQNYSWLTKAEASKVVLALRSMAKSRGIDPDTRRNNAAHT